MTDCSAQRQEGVKGCMVCQPKLESRRVISLCEQKYRYKEKYSVCLR